MPVLFTISTTQFRLTWSGPESSADTTAPPGRLRIVPLSSGVVVRTGPATTGATERSLRFDEQTRYRVLVRSLTGESVALRHADPLATRDVIGDEDGVVLSGTVDFEGQVGSSRFVVAVGGRDEVAFEVDVFPTKASFADVEAMRVGLDEALAGLAFEYLRSTSLPTQQSGHAPRRATWLTILRRALPDLEAALAHVAARPHQDLARTLHPVRTERVQHPDATLRRAVRTGQGGGPQQALASGVTVRSRLPERRAVATLDTVEHRWLRHQIDAARSSVSVVRQDEEQLLRSARRRRTLEDLADVEERLGRLVRVGPLSAASSVQIVPQPTQRLVTAPGYAEAYRACQHLAFGLSLADGPVPHATRDLHMLYEMWTYLTVVQRVGEVLGQAIPAHAFFRAEHRGLRLMLRRGRAHAIALEGEGLRVQIEYNPRFGRPGLLTQRPDLLLTVEGGADRRRYVLDAKYRRDDAAGYIRRYGAVGPPEDALGDLHRYRDAILDDDGGRVRRTVAQAVALYPHRAHSDFATSRLWTSIGTIGVGAIPLLPGQTDWLDDWLRSVLG